MTNYKKIFLTGGSGTLGAELIRISNNFEVSFVAPTSNACDIRSYSQVEKHIASSECDIILHSAALTDVKNIEECSIAACETNVVGTFNLIKACEKYNKKLVFVSTDHVFDGEKGNYKTTDAINPLTKYAKTKAAAELITRTYENSLIIRTSFFGHVFPYPAAFVDQWSSKDYVDLIAPKILKVSLSDRTGIVHVGSKRRSLYEIARERKNNIQKSSRASIKFISPIDTSLEVENE